MLQRFWDCSRLETKGMTAYAAKSAKMPSVLHASMHPEGIFTYYLRMVTSYFKLLLLSYLLPPQ